MQIITFSVLAEPKRGGGELPNIETAPAGNYSQKQKKGFKRHKGSNTFAVIKI